MVRPVLDPNEEQISFYMEIGWTITQWAHLEHAIYLVVSRAFPNDEAGALASGFYSIENFRSKLAFADRTFGSAPFAKEFLTEWDSVREEVRGLSHERNKLAHGRVIVYPQAAPGRRYAIVPFFGKQPKKKQRVPGPPPGSICVRDVDLIRLRCAKARNRLWSLYHRIGGEEDHFAESAQREPRPQTLAQLRRQIEAMHPPRAESSRGR